MSKLFPRLEVVFLPAFDSSKRVHHEWRPARAMLDGQFEDSNPSRNSRPPPIYPEGGTLCATPRYIANNGSALGV